MCWLRLVGLEAPAAVFPEFDVQGTTSGRMKGSWQENVE
jgi:hypothetical protein